MSDGDDVVASLDLRCYVVNLRRRPDRRAQLDRQLPSDLITRFTSDWDTETDGHVLASGPLEAMCIELFPWQISSQNPWWNRPLKWGEVGCTLAHLACWRAALADGATHALVLEDDAVLAAGWMDALQDVLTRDDSATACDLLYLGRVPLEPDRPSDLPGLVVPGYSHCTFGYLLTRLGLNTVLAAGLDRAIIPVDEFLPATYLPHPRPDVRRRFPPLLRALAFDPPLATQRPKSEAGSDTEESSFITAASRSRTDTRPTCPGGDQ